MTDWATQRSTGAIHVDFWPLISKNCSMDPFRRKRPSRRKASKERVECNFWKVEVSVFFSNKLLTDADLDFDDILPMSPFKEIFQLSKFEFCAFRKQRNDVVKPWTVMAPVSAKVAGRSNGNSSKINPNWNQVSFPVILTSTFLQSSPVVKQYRAI